MFFNSTDELFNSQNIEENLQVLSFLASTHFPSLFAFNLFKALYIPDELEKTCNDMFFFVNDSFMRTKVEDMINLLCEIYERLYEFDHLLPTNKFCPKARCTAPFLLHQGSPFEEDMWNSLCTSAVEGNYVEDGNNWTKCLKTTHIWSSRCPRCTTQLIVFKILLSAPIF